MVSATRETTKQTGALGVRMRWGQRKGQTGVKAGSLEKMTPEGMSQPPVSDRENREAEASGQDWLFKEQRGGRRGCGGVSWESRPET